MKLPTLIKQISPLVILILCTWYPNQTLAGEDGSGASETKTSAASTKELLESLLNKNKPSSEQASLTQTNKEDKNQKGKNTDAVNVEEKTIITNLFNNAKYENFESQNNPETNVVKIVPKQYLEP